MKPLFLAVHRILLFILVTFGVVFSVVPVHAQRTEEIRLSLIWENNRTEKFDNLPLKERYSDTLALKTDLENAIGELQSMGYLLASVTNLQWEKGKVKAYFSLGERYHWLHVRPGNIDKMLLRRVGYKEDDFTASPVNIEVFDNMRKSLIRYAENHGHPFATLSLDSLKINKNSIAGVMRYQPGPRIYFDSLIFIGEANIKKSFLANYLKTRKPTLFNKEPVPRLYSEALVEQTERLLADLPYLTLSSPPDVAFESGKAFLKLFLKERKASTVDGIVGVMPNNARDGKLLVTGQFNVELYNPFGGGKRISAMWQRVKPASPVYRFEYMHPNIFNTGLDLDLRLNSLKEDSTFFNLTWRAGMQLRVGWGHKLSLFYQQVRSRNLDAEGNIQTLGDANLQNIPSLFPGLTSSAFQAYGMSYQFSSLDRPIMPRRGWFWELEGKVGSKSFEPDPEVADSVYASVPLTSNQLVLTSNLQWYIPFGKNMSLLLKNRSGKIFNQALFANDLFRVGGLQSLRGFDENIFFASLYGVNTAEFRLYFENQSAFFLFFDQGYIRDESLQESLVRWPIGTGAGISLQTKGGLLTLIYSMGYADSQPFQPQNAKIHFSFRNVF